MKKVLSIVLAISLILSGFTFVFASGESAGAPILIGTAEELIAVASDVAADGGDGKYYKLTANINLNGADWTTYIGSKDIPFVGTFDGDGKVISNFKLPINSNQGYIGVGLFGTIGGNAVIKKLGFEKVEVYGTDQYGWNVYVGALAGEAVGNASVSESYIRDFVIDSQPVRAGVTGGLVGNVDGDGVKIENCYSVDFVEKDDASAMEGGLIGCLKNYSSVKNCYSNTTLAVYANSYPSKIVENSYCTSHDWYGDAQGAGTVVTSAELKGKYTDLGSAYVKGYAVYGEYPALAWESAPAGMTGAGSETDPYIVKTVEHLVEIAGMATTEGKYFELANDIDIENSIYSAFIGTKDSPFKGVFDGKGHIIKNFQVTIPATSSDWTLAAALFGYVSGDAVIKNFGVENVKVSSATNSWSECAGGIVGLLDGNAKVSGCYVNGIELLDKATPELKAFGGIAAAALSDGVVVENCYCTGITLSDGIADNDSGIVGAGNSFSEIKNCYSTYTIVRTAKANGSKVTNSYFTGVAPWPADGAEYTEFYAGEKVTAAELKGMATTLGTAFKAGGVETNGYPALSWQKVTEITVGEGEGTYDSPYLIADAEGLKAVAGFIDTEGVYFKLLNDIDLEGAVWENCIGSKANPFKGDFNGNGHVIKNYTLKVPGYVERGIFAAVGGNAYIHDLGVENVKVILTDINGWDATAGGLIACAYDNSVIEGCYVDGVEFKADYVRSETWYGELKWGGGLIGYGNGDGLELRDCYSKGFVETYPAGTNPIVNNEGGLFGMFDKMLAIEDCYSDTTIGRYSEPHLSRNSYHKGPCLEWPEGYTWGYNSFIKDVKTLGYDWNNDFVPVENGSPVLKWQEKDGYLNLIPSGEMTGNNLSSLSGVSGGTTVVSNEALRQSTVLAMPANSAFSYHVDLSEGDYYRVSFRGKTQNNEENAFTFTLGDKNLTDDLFDKTLGELWETKVVFVKADTANATLTISSDTALYIDDVEIIKVDPELEITAISESVSFEKTYADVLEELYVSSTVCDGLEVKINSDYDCIDRNGKFNGNVPVGFGTIDIDVTVSATLADRKAEKQKTITINKRTPYEIKNLGLYNEDGEKVFGLSEAEKIGTVDVKVNTEDEGTIFAVLYKDGILTGIEMTNVESGKAVFDLPIGDADKLKLFAFVEDTLVPLSVPSMSYDIIEKGSGVVMHTIGDSLCATYKVDETLLRGWGQVMGSYLDDEYITVDNTLAESGMTANKFFTTGGVKGGIKELIASYNPGDYLLVQLGTNDSANFIAANKGFTKEQFRFYMDQFVVSAREKGVIPVFVTAPERLSAGTDVKTDGVNYNVDSYLEDYPQIMRDYAAEYNVPVIDLNKESYKMLQEYGYSGTKALGLFVSDELHYTEAGANWIAGFVADELIRLGLPVGDCVLDNN